MTISTLKYTKWRFNNSLNLTPTRTWNLNFILDSTDACTGLGFNTDGYETRSNTLYGIADEETFTPYYEGAWESTPSTVMIIGGSDATNSTLISWFQANATRVLPSDLTGTTWVLDSTLDSSNVSVPIDFISNGSTFDQFTRVYDYGVENYLLYGDTTVYENGSWTSSAYRTITITGGTGATSNSLISWLEDNATYKGLGGTVWTLNKTLPTTGEVASYITFTSNSSTFRNFRFSGNTTTKYLRYYFTDVYTNGVWADKNYRVIHIQDDTSREVEGQYSDELLTWLRANATYGETGLSPTIRCKVNGSWKEGEVKVKVNGAWKDVDSVFVKVNGTWKEAN